MIFFPKKNRFFFNWDNFFSMLLVLVVLVFFPYVFTIDFLDPIQNTLEDFQITDFAFSKLRDESEIPMDTNIVLVNISIMNREQIAKQLKIISRFKPKVIGIDSFFKDEKDAEGDSLLSEAIREAGNVVLVTKLDDLNEENDTWESLVTSLPMFDNYAQKGYANFIINEDYFRTVRIFTPYQYYNDSLHYSFALQITNNYKPDAVDRFLKRGNETEIVNFKGNTDKFRTFDYFFAGEPDLSEIEGKIVLMGFMGYPLNALTNEDMFFTPMNNQYVGKSYPDMYGVVVWANIIAMILDEDFYNQTPEWFSQLLTFAILFTNMAFFTFLRHKVTGYYEALSIIWTFVHMIILVLGILMMFYLFRMELKLEGVFFGILISKQIYETWVDSLKLLILDTVKNKIKLKRKLKRIDT